MFIFSGGYLLCQLTDLAPNVFDHFTTCCVANSERDASENDCGIGIGLVAYDFGEIHPRKDVIDAILNLWIRR